VRARMRLPRRPGKIERMDGGKSVLIVDDHADFRSLTRRLLEAVGFVVAGEAENGGQAILATHALFPDVVLLDIQLPDIDGFEVARRLDGGHDGPVIVLTSTRDAADYGPRIDASPAAGFVPKAELTGRALTSLLADARR
jgi:CheY-like chemotaxis protein